jgi:signal peptidase I
VTGSPEPPELDAVPADDGAVPPLGVATADAPVEPEGEAPPARMPRWTRTTLEWTAVIAVALAVAFLIRAYVVQTYFIPSVSMEPTLQIGDHILVLKAAYDFTSPAIGDVVVFKAPPKEHENCSDPDVQDLVKRIIALPGDKIYSKGNQIFVDGAPLHQPWQYTQPLGTPITLQVVAPNSYFVMGDNRSNSCDSRVWGDVPRGNIIGKAIFIFWPPSRISSI